MPSPSASTSRAEPVGIFVSLLSATLRLLTLYSLGLPIPEKSELPLVPPRKIPVRLVIFRQVPLVPPAVPPVYAVLAPGAPPKSGMWAASQVSSSRPPRTLVCATPRRFSGCRSPVTVRLVQGKSCGSS